MSPPALELEQVLLGNGGEVKIGMPIFPPLFRFTLSADDLANIGDCLLSEDLPPHDSRSLGFLLLELMELGTRMADCNSLELRSPSGWGDQIQEFLRHTACEQLEVLKKVRLTQNVRFIC